MSAIASRYRTVLSTWLAGPRVRVGLFVLSVACIVGLAALKATGVDAGPLPGLLKVILPFSFVGLSIVDFRASVAIAVFELVLGGASGSWTEYGTRLSGRLLLDGVVMLRAASIVIADRRRGDRTVLGRYGAHALALAVLFPAIWMTIGLLNHNGAGNVFGDGNVFVFFAFAVVVITLVRSGDGKWFRNVFFAACATNGIANLLLILASASHLIDLASIRNALYFHLEMGGIIGHLSNGDFRLFTGASLYLQIGLALTAWRLLTRPRSYWYWVLYAAFCIDIVATYTRGLWIGGVTALALIVGLAAPTLKRALILSGVTIAGFAIAMIAMPVAGFSLSDYVFQRTASITSSGSLYPTAVVNPSFERSGAWIPVDTNTLSMHVRRVVSEHRSGSHALELTNDATGADDYVYQNLSVVPHKRYTVSAWINSRWSTPLTQQDRGLFLWDTQDGLTYNVPLRRTNGWKQLTLSFTTAAPARDVEIRLYADFGRVYWDDVHFAPSADAATLTSTAPSSATTPASTTAPTATAPTATAPTAPAPTATAPTATAPTASPPQPRIEITTHDLTSGDFEGEVSNAYRVREAKSLFRHIRQHPVIGSGFGAIATDFATSYRYELSYLDILYKAGIVGLLLLLSFPLRLIWDALRLRFGGAEKAQGVAPRGGAIVVAIIVSVMLAGATNPYLFAAFGLFPILAAVAWLEPTSQPATESRKN
jgi:hypothetical protein